MRTNVCLLFALWPQFSATNSTNSNTQPHTHAHSLSDLHTQSHNRIYSCFDPDHDDCVFVGELAVALEAINCTNAAKMMCEVFATLVDCSQVEEEVPEGDEGSLEYKQHELELKRQNSIKTLDYEKMVMSFSTLGLR